MGSEKAPPAGMIRESEIIGRIREAFGPRFIGDDAAVLPAGRGGVLLAADAMAERVHFDLRYSTIGQAVQKLVTSNIADIYAMGRGEPRAVLLTAGLPSGFGEDGLESLVEGLRIACDLYGVDLVGGDTVRSCGGLFLGIAVYGELSGGPAIERNGARPGDLLVLYGAVGGSLAGMRLLSMLTGEGSAVEGGVVAPDGWSPPAALAAARGLRTGMTAGELESLRAAHGMAEAATPALAAAAAHLVPRAAPLPGGMLAGEGPGVSALMDVSDGLAADLPRLCEAGGVGAEIDLEAIPTPPGLADLVPDRGRLLETALTSGEEYALLAAVRTGGGTGRAASRDGLAGGRVIGRIVERERGITTVDREGARLPLTLPGYEHEF